MVHVGRLRHPINTSELPIESMDKGHPGQLYDKGSGLSGVELSRGDTRPKIIEECRRQSDMPTARTMTTTT